MSSYEKLKGIKNFEKVENSIDKTAKQAYNKIKNAKNNR